MAAEKPKQIVLVSFDGAGPSSMWQWSRDLAKRSNAHFTYFLSCTMVLDRGKSKSYQGPGMKPGRSNIGFAPDEAEVRARLGHIWQAVQDGNEIGSHTCGHFDGGKWGANEWKVEFEAFRRVVENAWITAGATEPEGWRAFVRNGIQGFRAPYLSESQALVQTLAQQGFAYNASGVTRGPQNPTRQNGVLQFGLPLIPEGPNARPVIAMDYNLYARHSGAKEDKANAAAFEERAYAAFQAAFEKEYQGSRIPFQLGFHFTEMNGGAYWRALERFTTNVCGKPDVACVTYAQAMTMMKGSESTPVKAGL